MFFGHIISQNKPYVFNAENVGPDAGEVLSLTNVVLAPGSKVKIILNVGKRIIVRKEIKHRVLSRHSDQIKTTSHY